MRDTPRLDGATWRKSSFSGGQGGDCVEISRLVDGTTAVRDSKHPDAGVLYFTSAEMDAFLKGAKSGEFDDLAT